MGYANGKSKDSGDSSDAQWTSSEWADTADDYNDVADRAARAAREDRRWDKLSNAVTDFQAAMEQMAKVEDDSLPQADRDTARAEIDRLDVQAIHRVISQECRKAQAQ
ncbi:hypothetical protein [Streptomyces bacillaris]|uniref:hypothetical protein n=1 Tax=Streptomyces bacillaris TaxID=68179 RepID=UPI00346141BC